MDVTTIAFLILLGGTPAEHIIAMPTMDDCHRVAEGVTQYECLDLDQFDAKILSAGTIDGDFQPASDSAPTRPTVAPNPMDGMPSALKRQARRALYPETARDLPSRVVRISDTVTPNP